MKRAILTFAALSAVLFAGCRSVPITGRNQLLLTSNAYEQELGLSSYRESTAANRPTSDTRQQNVLKRIGTAIASVAPENDFQWEFQVLESPEVNAFCLPGGKVAVYTGIMPKFANEAEMACVVAHEIGHAIARHGGERMSWGCVDSICSLGVSAWLGGTAAEIYGIGSQYGVILPFSRKHENEADLIGLYLMAKAGYEPQAAVDFWSRFGGGDSSPLGAFASTHPSDEERVANMTAHQDEARGYYAQAATKRGYGVKFANGIPQE
ncbi:MAG: M48 family metallopeptidase [Kiritimatiellae bacterium]|nr:M48 family metallopeptidase [Kiritimatiellia bacterium]